MSNLDRIVGMKSILSSALVSSHRPNTELAAASTEQREFRVVVMPACKSQSKINNVDNFETEIIRYNPKPSKVCVLLHKMLNVH